MVGISPLNAGDVNKPGDIELRREVLLSRDSQLRHLEIEPGRPTLDHTSMPASATSVAVNKCLYPL